MRHALKCCKQLFQNVNEKSVKMVLVRPLISFARKNRTQKSIQSPKVEDNLDLENQYKYNLLHNFYFVYLKFLVSSTQLHRFILINVLWGLSYDNLSHNSMLE